MFLVAMETSWSLWKLARVHKFQITPQCVNACQCLMTKHLRCGVFVQPRYNNHTLFCEIIQEQFKNTRIKPEGHKREKNLSGLIMKLETRCTHGC